MELVVGENDSQVVEIIPEPDMPTTLSILSFNFEACSDVDEIKERLDIIVNLNPDVIAFQGITLINCEQICRIIKSSKYKFTRFDGPNRNKEFEILASKNSVSKGGYTPFIKSSEQRGICKILVVAGGDTPNPQKVWVFTSCFDSNSVVNRKNQMIELVAEAKKHNDYPVIFAGDTNIPSWQDLSFPEATAWKDAWREKGASSNEKTTLHDRKDRMGCCNETLCEIESFDIVKFETAEDVRRGIFATFRF